VIAVSRMCAVSLKHDRVAILRLRQVIIIALARSALGASRAAITDSIDDRWLPMDDDLAIGTD